MNRVFISGASSGIGEALALEYARRGAQLILFARRETELKRVASECERYSALGCVVYCVGNVRSEADLKHAISRGVEAFGGIDTVIANAGFGISGKFEELELDRYLGQFDTNVWGLLKTVRAGLG